MTIKDLAIEAEFEYEENPKRPLAPAWKFRRFQIAEKLRKIQKEQNRSEVNKKRGYEFL